MARAVMERAADREHWLALRKAHTGIGSSDVARILGVSPYGGAWDLWQQRTGLAPETPPGEPDHYTLGHLLEDDILRLYQTRALDLAGVGLTVVANPGPGPVVFRNEDQPWMVCTPDALVVDGHDQDAGGWENYPQAGVDAKNVGLGSVRHWRSEDGLAVPYHLELQMRWCMAVMSVEWWDVAALILGSEWHRFQLTRDRDLETWLVNQVSAWRDRHLIQGEPPDVDGSDECGRVLLARHPQAKLGLREATERELELLTQLEQVRAARKQLETQESLLINQMKEAIGDARGVEGPVGRALWSDRRGAVNYRTACEVAGVSADVIEATRGPGTRVFTVTVN